MLHQAKEQGAPAEAALSIDQLLRAIAVAESLAQSSWQGYVEAAYGHDGNITSGPPDANTVRFNANHGLVDALRMGVPAIGCVGDNMASRLGGSIIHAAGLGDLVLDSPDACFDHVIALGRDPRALQQLRVRLARQQEIAPLFDPQARVREWEFAWAAMAQRQAEGLLPEAFDVPEQASTRL
ncbi:MAG: hypothetical protein ABIQ82_04035 [Variovorax sp.]